MPGKYSVVVKKTLINLKLHLKKIEKFQKFPPIFMRKTYFKDIFFSRNLSFTPGLLKPITDFKRGVPKKQ